MEDDFDENKKKKGKKEDRENDDLPSENFNDLIKYLADNFKKILPEFEKFFSQFQDQIEKGNLNLDQFDNSNFFRITGNNLPQKPKATILSKSSPTKNILVDIIDSGEEIIIIAELPGLEKQDIKLNLKSKSLLISVHKRKIHKRIPLPCKVDKGHISASYKNGILEIKLNKL